jgi:hypothetical protein
VARRGRGRKTRGRLAALGLALVALGLGGAAAARAYLDANPGDALGISLMTAFGADSSLPPAGRVVAFLAHFGVLLGLVGAVLALVALRRR